ncbi:MAG: hypothetical protein KJI72_00225 [Patescibacteria group bacterium]|nr:hypothetical protein [Patescibacteria group bacterium]
MLTDIKNEIKTLLDALKTAGTLGFVISTDFKKDITDYNIGKYPAAILAAPSISSEVITNRDNLRTYKFDILILEKGENVTSANQIETLVETIIDKFDNDPTLNGKADGGVEPSTSEPEATTIGDQTYIAFIVTIRARATKALTF